MSHVTKFSFAKTISKILKYVYVSNTSGLLDIVMIFLTLMTENRRFVKNVKCGLVLIPESLIKGGTGCERLYFSSNETIFNTKNISIKCACFF